MSKKKENKTRKKAKKTCSNLDVSGYHLVISVIYLFIYLFLLFLLVPMI